MKKDKGAGLKFIIGGVVLFILKYIPFYHYDKGIINKYLSLDSAAGLCNSFFGNFADECNFVKPLNLIVIFASIGLIAYGAYLLYEEKKHKID